MSEKKQRYPNLVSISILYNPMSSEMRVAKEYTAENLAKIISIKRKKQKGNKVDLVLDTKWEDPLSFLAIRFCNTNTGEKGVVCCNVYKFPSKTEKSFNICSCKLTLNEFSEETPEKSMGCFLFNWLEMFGKDKTYGGNGRLRFLFTIHVGDETKRPLLLDNAPSVKIIWDKEKIKEEMLDKLYEMIQKQEEARPPPVPLPEIEPPLSLQENEKPRAEVIEDTP